MSQEYDAPESGSGKIPWNYGPMQIPVECVNYVNKVMGAEVPSTFTYRQNLLGCNNVIFLGRRVYVEEIVCNWGAAGMVNRISVTKGEGTYIDFNCF